MKSVLRDRPPIDVQALSRQILPVHKMLVEEAKERNDLRLQVLHLNNYIQSWNMTVTPTWPHLHGGRYNDKGSDEASSFRHKTVFVDAKEHSTAHKLLRTGITFSRSDPRIRMTITATGTACAPSNVCSGPEGLPWPRFSRNGETFFVGSLVGKITTDPDGLYDSTGDGLWFIGRYHRVTNPPHMPGELVLGVESSYEDNTGGYYVTISYHV